MYVNIVFFTLIIVYTIYSIFRVNVTNGLVRIAITFISLMVAVTFNQYSSMRIADAFELLQLDSNNEYILGMEVLYYKTTAFISVFILSFAVLIVITNIINIPKHVKIYDNIYLRAILGFINVFVITIISMNVFLSSPLSLIYGNEFSYILANLLGFDNILSGCTFNYSTVKSIVNSSSHLGIPDMNLTLLDYLVENEYATKDEIKVIVSNSNLVTDRILDWFSK